MQAVELNILLARYWIWGFWAFLDWAFRISGCSAFGVGSHCCLVGGMIFKLHVPFIACIPEQARMENEGRTAPGELGCESNESAIAGLR